MQPLAEPAPAEGVGAAPAEEDGKRDVTLDEAIRMAIQFQQRVQLDEADQVWSVVLQALPDHPMALHFSGVPGVVAFDIRDIGDQAAEA